MRERKLSIVYESSINDLTEINSSFDRGILRVAYTGKNRNKSFISKSTFEKCINTIYNVPIVCNYNRETDSIGAHDVDVVKTGKGIRLINVTQPVGVVPESANYWWEKIEEDNGDIHEYLCVEVIIWKRQEAYAKIKENGITDESMEIKVISGQTINDYYHIDSFEFTAFCLLESAEPCYESACIEMFTLKSFRNEYTKMMSDFKDHFQAVTTSKEDDINPQENITQNLSKGGNISLDKMKLLSQYGLTVETVDFNIDDYTIEELKVKFEALKKKVQLDDDDDTVGTSADDKDEAKTTEDAEEASAVDNQADIPDNSEGGESIDDETYSLTGEQFVSQLCEALSSVTYTDPFWGEIFKYNYVDYDYELSEVYCYDCEDWKLYGFPYSMNGDNAVIDFECKKRKKISIVDFDEGNVDYDYKYTFDSFGKAILTSKDAEISRIKSELSVLKQFKQEKLNAERKEAEDELFARFADLNGMEAFESLRANCSEMSLEDIESKCFEIKGRSSISNFSINNQKSTRIVVEKKHENEPYGGLFLQYMPTKI